MNLSSFVFQHTIFKTIYDYLLNINLRSSRKVLLTEHLEAFSIKLLKTGTQPYFHSTN